MFRFIHLRQTSLPVRLGLTVFGFRVFDDHEAIRDTPAITHPPLQLSSCVVKETGWDRFKQIFQKDEYGSLSPELESTLSAGLVGLMIGSALGGVNASKRSYEDFVERNKATPFKNSSEAKFKLRRSVSKAVRREAFRVGWRLGLFTGFFVFFTTAVSTYRNKTSVLEYAAGGLLSGAVYRIPVGPKAMFATGVVGCGLGAVAGCVSVAVMKLTGTTTEELRYWRKGWKEAHLREFTSITNQSRSAALGKVGMLHELELMERMREEAERKETGNVEPSKEAPKGNEKETVCCCQINCK